MGAKRWTSKAPLRHMAAAKRVVAPALWTAASQGRVEAVRQSLADNEFLNTEEKGGPSQTTPLLAAAERGHNDVVRLLLEHGVDVSASDTFEWTALAYTALVGNEEVARMLLLHGASTQDGFEESTPLHYAAQQGHMSVACLLLEHAARVDALDEEIRTPLHRAASQGHEDMALLLLDHGADVSAENRPLR